MDTPSLNGPAASRTARIGFAVGLAAICVAAAWARRTGLDPGALWYDDAWVALVRKVGWHEGVLGAGRSSPVGFTLIMKVILDAGTDVELAGQALPFAAGLALIPVFGLLVLRMFRSRSLGVLAAALIAVSPAIVTYSTHVKQYTLEGLATLLLLGIFLQVISTRALRPLAALVTVSVLLQPFGHSVCFVAVVLIHLGALALWLAPREHQERHEAATRSLRGRRALSVACCAAFDLALALYYALLLRRQKTGSLEHYWEGRHVFMPLGESHKDWVLFLRDHVWRNFLAGSFPQGGQVVLLICAALAALGLVVSLRRTEQRWFGLAVLALYAQSLVLSALRLYPLGGYRIDIYLHPVHLLLVVSGLAYLLEHVRDERFRALATSLLTLLIAARFLPGIGAPRITYPEGQGAADLIAVMEQEKTADDAALVYPEDRYVFALYTHWNVQITGRPGIGSGYDIRVREPGVIMLPRVVPAQQRLGKNPLTKQAYRRLFLICVKIDATTTRHLLASIRNAGYHATSKRSVKGTKLLIFETDPPEA